MPDQPNFNTSHAFRGNIPDASKMVPLNTAGYRIVEDKKVTLNKALCEKMLSLSQVPGDRPLIDAHVEFLMMHMMRGTFLYENHNLASAFCKEDGKEYRINSQHSCFGAWELEDKGVRVEHGKSRYIKYEADTLDDVRQLYSLYDRLRMRSKSNVVVATLFDTEEFGTVGQDMLKRVASAYAFWQWDSSSERSRHDANEIVQLIKTTHLSVCQNVIAFLKNVAGFNKPEGRPFRRAAVMGAMFEIFDAAPQKAIEFWTPVCDGLNLNDATDPRHKLRNALNNTNVLTNASNSMKKKADPEVMYRWSIFAWNAWRRGDQMLAMRAPLNTQRPRATKKVGRRNGSDDAD